MVVGYSELLYIGKEAQRNIHQEVQLKWAISWQAPPPVHTSNMGRPCKLKKNTKGGRFRLIKERGGGRPAKSLYFWLEASVCVEIIFGEDGTSSVCDEYFGDILRSS